MLNLLDIGKSQKILEVGSGSGYVLALINEIAEDAEIYGTELLFQLVEISKSALRTRGNIHIYHTPSSLGLSDKGPFDRILVSAAANRLPPELISQLADNGVIVAPVANSILKAKKTGNDLTQEDYPGFSFVPLIENGSQSG
jgi:protein-L-isoaspartate(D-aspartate) O-methyltransferase